MRFLLTLKDLPSFERKYFNAVAKAYAMAKETDSGKTDRTAGLSPKIVSAVSQATALKKPRLPEFNRKY